MAKVLDALRVEHTLIRRWGTPPPLPTDPGPRPDLEGAPGHDLGEGCDS